jgi:hypothetical protein
MPELITKYLYFWGSIMGLGIFSVIYQNRPDLRRRMLRTGIAVGVLGVFSEGVFFRDYWHPPLLFHFGRFGGIEDFFFGIFFGGVCVALYDVTFHKRLKRLGHPHYWITSVVLVSEVAAILMLGRHIDSIYASALGFLVPIIFIVSLRRDLIPETILSAFLGGSLLILAEMACLIVNPSYLQNYFYLYGKVPLIFGVVPFTEFMWGACFAALFGPLRDFEYGYLPVDALKRRVTLRAKR